MWRETWETSDAIARSLHRFLSFLTRFMEYGGRFSWTSIKVVIQQYAVKNGRPYSSRWIEKLLQAAVRAGLIRRVRGPAPGRAAVYEAVIPGHPGYRPVKVRRRGIRPRRLLALWRHEEEETAMSGRTGRTRGYADRTLRHVPEATAAGLAAPRDLSGRPMMSSRGDTVCSACPDPVIRGELIVRTPAGWVHHRCTEVPCSS